METDITAPHVSICAQTRLTIYLRKCWPQKYWLCKGNRASTDKLARRKLSALLRNWSLRGMDGGVVLRAMADLTRIWTLLTSTFFLLFLNPKKIEYFFPSIFNLSGYSLLYQGSCHKRQKEQAPTPQAPIRNSKTRKVANAKVRNRCTNLT